MQLDIRQFLLAFSLLMAGLVSASQESQNVAESSAGTPSAPVKVATQIRVEGAYINVPVPGTKHTAAYFILRNLGEKPAQLVSVTADVATRSELHSHTTKDGMMQMRKEEKISVPAKSSVAFASGSYHVMLFDLQRSIQSGEELQLLLTFADGKHVLATAKVKSIFDDVHHHH